MLGDQNMKEQEYFWANDYKQFECVDDVAWVLVEVYGWVVKVPGSEEEAIAARGQDLAGFDSWLKFVSSQTYL